MENKMRRTLAARVIGQKHLLLEEVFGIGVSPKYEIIKGVFKGEHQIGEYLVLDYVEIYLDQPEECLIEAFNKYLDHYISMDE